MEIHEVIKIPVLLPKLKTPEMKIKIKIER